MELEAIFNMNNPEHSNFRDSTALYSIDIPSFLIFHIQQLIQIQQQPNASSLSGDVEIERMNSKAEFFLDVHSY